MLANLPGQNRADGTAPRFAFMQKLLLLSIIFGTIALPARAARIKSPTAGFRKVVIYMLLFDAFYFVVLRFLYAPS